MYATKRSLVCLRIFIVRILVVAGLVGQMSAQRSQLFQSDCDDNANTLLEVDFNNVTFLESSTNQIVEPYFKWMLTSESFVYPGEHRGYYRNRHDVEEIVPFSRCIPMSSCFLLKTANFDTEAQVTIRLNGTDFPLGRTILESAKRGRLHSTTEIGSCVPQCQNDEALFDLQAFAASYQHYQHIVPWILKDVRDGKTLMTCSRRNGICSSDGEIEIARQCVPRDGCYRFAVGAWSNLIKNTFLPRTLTFNASFDGTSVVDFRNTFFDSVDFGESCDDIPRLFCKDNESLIQVHLFWWGGGNDITPDLNWSLLDGKKETTLKNGTFINKSIGEIHVVNECVPKRSCIEFVPTLPSDLRAVCYCTRWDGITIESYECGCAQNVIFLYRVFVDGVDVGEDAFQFEVSSDGKPFLVSDPFSFCVSNVKLSNVAIGGIVSGVVIACFFILAAYWKVQYNRENMDKATKQ